MTALLKDTWVAMLKGFDRLIVGYSGGLDSTVLLHALATVPELSPHIHAVHIHHGLSTQASHWQHHCELFCQTHAISLVTHHVTLTKRTNVEEEARHLRFNCFASILQPHDCLLLAHHRDDQAETLLLQLCRGAGIHGLAGMASQRRFAKGSLIRPFLELSREDLRAYAMRYALTWIEDESNMDPSFARNYVRHHVMPLLQNRWPAVTRKMEACAKHCQQAKVNLDDLAHIDYPALTGGGNHLLLDQLLHLSEARLINVLRVWLTNQGTRAPKAIWMDRLLREVIFAREDSNPCLPWGAFQIRRYRKMLYLLSNDCSSFLENLQWSSFPEAFKTSLAKKGLHIPIGSCIEIRFRKGGERLVWHGKTRELKKLFQTWGVPPWLRARIPLIYVNDNLAAVLDFCVSDLYYQAHGDRV